MKRYSANGILGRGAIFNLINSDRSDGKTFDCIYRALLRARDGLETLYVRRWDNDVTKRMMQGITSDVLNKKPELSARHEYTLEGRVFKIREIGDNGERGKDNPKEWRAAITFGSLSDADGMKSGFNPENVREIDIDEYCPLNRRFLKDEMTSIFELYESADRNRGIVKLCVFGNRLVPLNPFTIYFGLTSELEKIGISVYRNGTLAVQSWGAAENREQREKNPLHELTKGTEYGGYIEGGKVLNGYGDEFRPTPESARTFVAFRTSAGEGTVLYSGADFFVTCRKPRDAKYILCDAPIIDKGGIKNAVSIRLPKMASVIRTAYHTARLFFDTKQAKRAFLPLLLELPL